MNTRDNFLHLYPGGHDQGQIPYRGHLYTFQIWSDQENGQEETGQFMVSVYDVIEELARNHVVLYSAYYTLLKESKKKLLGKGRKPAKFNQSGATARLKRHLEESGWSDGWFADREETTKKGWFWHDRKELYIVQEKLDIELLKKTDTTYAEDEGRSGILIVIFPEGRVKINGTAEQIIDYYRNNMDFLLYVGAEVLVTQSDIVINPRLYSKEQLAQQMQKAVQKHNKTLEVHL